MKNPFLVGSAIYLRPLERDDAPVIAPWLNDAAVTRLLRRHRPMSIHGEEEFLAAVAQSETDVVVGIALIDDDRLIGVTGLTDVDPQVRQAQFGIMIGAVAEWGKGYGTDATRLIVGYGFETLNLNRVWLHVIADNTRGLTVYEKIGFQREGVLRQEHYREGRYWDAVVMSLLRVEWRATASADRVD